jgi:hypothetical protein
MPVENINPQVKKVYIGRKVLRKLEVLPMSVGDQLKFGEALKSIMKRVFAIPPEQMRDAQVVQLFLDLIGENIQPLLKMVVDPMEDPETILGDLTNTQLEELAMIVYQENFESLAKKLGGLKEQLPDPTVLDLEKEVPVA